MSETMMLALGLYVTLVHLWLGFNVFIIRKKYDLADLLSILCVILPVILLGVITIVNFK